MPMFSFAALEVALGLIFVYLILSLACTAMNETVSSLLSWRAKFLRHGIANLLDPANHSNGLVLAGQLYAHPLVNALIRPFPPGGRERYPSYIPSRTFVNALLDFDASGASRSVEHAIDRVPSDQAKKALKALYERAEGDVIEFRRSVEQWFDDAMERVSGWYRRRVQLMMWVFAALIVVPLNVDTIRIAQNLWSEDTVRAAVVARADNATQATDLTEFAKDVDSIDQLEIPIGWGVEERPSGATDWLLVALFKAVGLVLTGAALTLGAPFWFDMLSKVARIRSAGAPPPASDAVRKGEGEQERVGPSGLEAAVREAKR
jgi:hypothetical protein